jgi:hypothetical protein
VLSSFGLQQSVSSLCNPQKRPSHTLCHIDIGAGEAIRSKEAGVHVDAVLRPLVSRRLLADNPVEQQTESSTPPRALSSPSTMSFLRWSSVMVRCVAFPFATGAVVGPEGTVGACRLPVLMVLAANPFKTRRGARVHRLETRNSRHGLQATMPCLGS